MVKSKFPVKVVGTISIVTIIGVVALFLFIPFSSILPNPSESGLEIPFPMPEPDEVVIEDPFDLETEDADPEDPVGELIFTDPVHEVTDEEEEAVIIAINNTETSDDPPIDQIIDIIFEPKAIKLEANVVKIDSTLNRFNETFAIDVPLASIFVEDTTNIDFRSGFVEVSLDIITDPNSQVTADGTFNIDINGIEIFEQDIPLTSSGMTDEDGKIELSFNPLPTVTSKEFTFDIDVFFSRFLDDRLSKLTFKVKTLNIDVDAEQINGLVDQEIFTMDIFRNDFQIFITDSQGNQVRTYPQDDKITVKSIESSFTCRWKGSKQTHCNSPVPYVCATYTAPNLGTVTLKDLNGILLDSGSGTGLIIDETVFRNANYSLTSPSIHADVGAVDLLISTPKSQANFEYSCWKTPDSVTKTNYPLFHRGVTCGTGTMTSPSTSTHTVCNIS